MPPANWSASVPTCHHHEPGTGPLRRAAAHSPRILDPAATSPGLFRESLPPTYSPQRAEQGGHSQLRSGHPHRTGQVLIFGVPPHCAVARSTGMNPYMPRGHAVHVAGTRHDISALPTRLEYLDGYSVAGRHAPPLLRPRVRWLHRPDHLVARYEGKTHRPLARVLPVIGAAQPAGLLPGTAKSSPMRGAGTGARPAAVAYQ